MVWKPHSLAILEPKKNVGYGSGRLPSVRDREIHGLLRGVETDEDVGYFVQTVPHDGGRVLNAFAERAASMAVRRQDARELRAGLLALLIAQRVSREQREIMPTLALLYRAAEMIGHDPRVEFTQICDKFGASIALVNFVRRTPDDRAIQAMGFEEGDDEDGFRFLRNW